MTARVAASLGSETFSPISGRMANSAALGAQVGVERPVLHGLEGLDLALAVHDEPDGHRLDTTGRQPRDLLPQEWRETVADEAVQHAARLLGVHLLEVDLAGMLERLAHRALGDLVEGHPIDLPLVHRKLLDQVPADRLALAVRVGGHVERVDLLGRLLEIVQDLLWPGSPRTWA